MRGIASPVTDGIHSMTEWHRENGYIRNFAIIAAYEMAQFLFKRNHNHPDAWFFIEAGSELKQLQYMKVHWELAQS